MTDVWFYHLERHGLDKVLPILLERSLQRGWRAVVQAGSPERVDVLDQLLWTFSDDSFLPHGTIRDGEPETQPVFLTDGPDNPNGATVRFIVDAVRVAPVLDPGAGAGAGAAYQRVVLLFDGRDDEAVAGARRQWSELKAAGHTVSYYQQSDDGRWEKRA